MVWPHPHYGKERALREQPWKLDEIERELRAQIELTRREVPQLSHLSDHMGFTSLGSEVAALVKRLAVEYGLDIDPEALGARTVGWYGKPEAPADKVTSFTRLVEELGPGTWIFVDHPALDTPELRATGHVGYEQVAVDRQGVTDAWTSAAVKEIVRRRGIELVGYRDLARAAAPDGEARVVEYLRAHVKPGQPVVVSELYNTVFTAPEERAALDRLFNTFFKMPLYMAQHQKAAGKPPSLAEISEQFRFPVPGEADVMLRVMESDPRMPRFIARDPATGEITRVDVEAILAHPRFGRALERTIAGWEGRPAPPFSAATYDDQPLTSESLAGTPHLLYFWFTGCPPCVRTSPLLAELHRAHAARGFRIVALNADRTLELPYADVDRTAYATAQGWEFTLAHMTPETQEAHGAVSVFPTMFFVDRRGTVVKHLVNFQDKATLEEAVEAAMR
jgi:thiol-disulfide isomerase/thioredoxin